MNQGYKNIDDLFRSEFKDFELDPPEHVWENVKNSIPTSGRNNPFYRFRYGGIIGLSSILILAGLFSYRYFTRTAETESNIIAINTAEKEMNLQAQEPVIEISTRDDIAVVEFSNESSNHSIKTQTQRTVVVPNPSSLDISGTKSGVSEIEESGNNLITDNSSSGYNQNTTVASFDTEQNPDAAKDNLLALADGSRHVPVTSLPGTYNNSIEDQELELSNAAVPNETNPAEPSAPDFKSDYGKKGNILLGLTFTPEITFFPSDNKLTNQSYSVDGSVIYKFSGYMLQSGLGVQFASDDGHYKVDYRKFLGTYQDVYDVTFDTNENGNLVPVYHTQTVEVYDSISRVSLTPTKNRYTYLQIPLYFGYGEDYKRVSWFVKGGPSLAILIHEGQPSVNFNSGNNKVLSSETELPARINTNWSFVFSAGLGYKLGNHVSVTLEPTMRFYMKSAYERNVVTTKHPYSFGIRTGLLFGF